MSTSQDLLTQERDAKFKAWLQTKAIRDKAFEVGIHSAYNFLLCVMIHPTVILYVTHAEFLSSPTSNIDSILQNWTVQEQQEKNL